MKLIVSVLLLSVFFCLNGNAQALYPLSIGNRWEYWDAYPPPDIYAWTDRVISDTTVASGITYRVIHGDGAIAISDN
jgi:hypothetical protein